MGGAAVWRVAKHEERQRAAERSGRVLGHRAAAAASRQDQQRRAAQLRLLGRVLTQLARQRAATESDVEYDGLKWRMRTTTETGFVRRVRARLARARRHGFEVVDDGTLDETALRRLYRAAAACSYCELPLEGLVRVLDHLTPLHRGGVHSIDNVGVCCRRCNDRKGHRTLEAWLADDARAYARVCRVITNLRAVGTSLTMPDAGRDDPDQRVGPALAKSHFRFASVSQAGCGS